MSKTIVFTTLWVRKSNITEFQSWSNDPSRIILPQEDCIGMSSAMKKRCAGFGSDGELAKICDGGDTLGECLLPAIQLVTQPLGNLQRLREADYMHGIRDRSKLARKLASPTPRDDVMAV